MRLLKYFGWKIIGKENLKPKSVILVAPHTSMWDGFWGLLGLWEMGLEFRTLAASWLFKGPGSWIMRGFLKAIPVKPGSGASAIRGVVREILQDPGVTHVIICPEGHLAPTPVWGTGYRLISRLTGFSVDAVVIDYRTREIRVLDYQGEPLSVTYGPWKDAAKFSEKFVLPINNV